MHIIGNIYSAVCTMWMITSLSMHNILQSDHKHDWPSQIVTFTMKSHVIFFKKKKNPDNDIF